MSLPAKIWIREHVNLWVRPGYTLELEPDGREDPDEGQLLDGGDGFLYWRWSVYWKDLDSQLLEEEMPKSRLVARKHRYGKKVRSWDVPRKWANQCIDNWERAL
jgi:hypothetical protein|tara:strand:- start:4197 stop:4508 length:312 start_codon:yes stop_codon:yes gene_type:complete